MEKTKVISVRLRQSTIDDLDQLASKNYYWSRNAIIEQLIRKMLDFADEATLWRIIKAYHSATETQKIEFVTQSPRN